MWPRTRFAPRSAVRTLAAVAVSLLLPGAATASAAGPVFAKNGYWQGFVDFWLAGLQKQNGIVVLTVGLGIVALLIITRGSSQRK